MGDDDADGTDADDAGETDDTVDDETGFEVPGFGVVTALIATLAAALIARRE